jgi:hypothetical protein
MANFIIQPAGDYYFFALVRRSGKLLLTSGLLPSIPVCESTIHQLRQCGRNSENFILKKTGNGRLYFTLQLDDGSEIAVSRMFRTPESRAKVVKVVAQEIFDAEVVTDIDLKLIIS